jgi:hypothetical protein
MSISIVLAPELASAAYDGSNQKTYAGLVSGGYTPVAGDYVVAAVMNTNNRGFNFVRLGGQAMTPFPNHPLDDFFADIGLWQRRVTGAESDANVLAEITGSDGTASPMGAVVVRGLKAAPNAQGAVLNAGSNTSFSVGPITPGTADNIGFGFQSGANRTVTPGAGWVPIGTLADPTTFLFAYKIQTSLLALSFDFTFDSAGTSSLVVGSLDADPSVAPPPPFQTTVDTRRI